ncbi:hypothetical protein NW755_010398 [Fusarium falciforme]|uniref:Uncharacterized protein n=1 Tax=Fusarium falciforme TaxID=195108 RepID=A0A9W8R1K5_9HYPO|nr:hypothetical protein NW755_010398 [Fusarium falciforme]
MDAIRGLFGTNPQRGQLPKVESDYVYPTSLLDDTYLFRDLILTWTFCFNDVLDADKLHSSLTRLLDIGDWRKFGGRLRLNEDGRLEIHVPREFTPERPAVRYAHEAFDMSISKHPVGKKMPKFTEKPSIHPGAQEFKEFAVTKDDPVNGSDLFKGDKPQMSLRIVSFSDATLVSLVWPHSAMDAVGFQAMLKNWSLVMAGRESEVLPVLRARDDMAYEIAEPPSGMEETAQEELHLAQKRISGLKLVLFGLWFLWDLLWQGACQSKSIFLPKEAVAKLMRQALGEAAVTTPPGDDKPFVSEGDVLAAWTTRLIASSDPRRLPVTTLTTVNLRYRFKSLMQTTGVYTQNLASAAYTFLSPAMARGPIGPIAVASRQHLEAQTTEPQLRAIMRTLITEKEKKDTTLLFGEPKMLLVLISNWTKAKIMQAADLSPAVIRHGEGAETRTNKSGTMIQLSPSTMKQSIVTRNVMVIKGKDHEGNYWLEGSLLPRTWVKVEEELTTLGAET